MTDHTTVRNFIREFSNMGPDVIHCFTSGNCYWFAAILKLRFPEGDIMYDEIENHFGFQYSDKTYDITGDVTNIYRWEPWQNVFLRDPIHGKRIEKDCILKERR